MMDGADLSLELGEQIELVRGECFGLLFKGSYFGGPVRLFAGAHPL